MSQDKDPLANNEHGSMSQTDSQRDLSAGASQLNRGRFGNPNLNSRLGKRDPSASYSNLKRRTGTSNIYSRPFERTGTHRVISRRHSLNQPKELCEEKEEEE